MNELPKPLFKAEHEAYVITVNVDTGMLYRERDRVLYMYYDQASEMMLPITKDYIYHGDAFKDREHLVNNEGILSPESGHIIVPSTDTTFRPYKDWKAFVACVLHAQDRLDSILEPNF